MSDPRFPGFPVPHATTASGQAAVPAQKQSSPVALLLLALPTLACLGSYVPVFGSIFGFRVAAILLVLAAFLGPRRSNESFGGSVQLLCFVWLASAVILRWLLPPGYAADNEMFALVFGLALCLAASRLEPTTEYVRPLLLGWLVAAVVLLAIGYRESLTGHHWSNYLTGNDAAERSNALAATLGNPNNFALFIVCVFPLLIALNLSARSLKARLLSLVVGVLYFPLLIATDSRLALVCVAVMVATVALRNSTAATRVILAVAAGAAAAIGAGYLANSNATPGADVSTTVRVNLIRNGIEMAKESSGLGFGPGGFTDHLIRNVYPHSTEGITSPHSLLIELLVNYGAVVTIGFIALCVSMFHHAARNRRSAIRTAVLTSVVLLPIAGQMNSSWIVNNITWAFLATNILLVRALPTPRRPDGDSLGSAEKESTSLGRSPEAR